MDIPQTAIPEQHGRVVIEATDGPMRVSAKYDPSFVPPGGAPETTRSGVLCTTPCVVDLPRGRYRLFFSAVRGSDAAQGDVDEVEVKDGLQIYRRAPGRYRTPTMTDGIGPGILLGGAIVLLSAGIMLASADDGSVAAGGVMIGAGVAGSIGGGFWAYNASRAEQQDGATTLFHAEGAERRGHESVPRPASADSRSTQHPEAAEPSNVDDE